MTDQLSREKLDEIEATARSMIARRQALPWDEAPHGVVFEKPETVLSLVARARRADELSKRVAEPEARVEYLS